MSGVLVVVALLVAIVVVFGAAFRRRAQARLRDVALPEELGHTPAQALRKAPTRAPAVPPPAVGPAPAGRPLPTGGGLHYLLIYDVGPDFISRRQQYRNEHLAVAWKAAGAGELLLAGALEEPTEQAFLLFRGTRDAARRFAESDPYVMHGLVRRWYIKQWHTVAGDAAALPLRPGSPLQ